LGFTIYCIAGSKWILQIPLFRKLNINGLVIETISGIGTPKISNGDHMKIGLIKACDHLPRYALS
jgi:hypothetical protein